MQDDDGVLPLLHFKRRRCILRGNIFS